VTQYIWPGYYSSFSPDGKKILNESRKAGTKKTVNLDIWVFDIITRPMIDRRSIADKK